MYNVQCTIVCVQNLVVVALSMLASVFNGVFMIGVPAEMHYYGPRYLYGFLGSFGAMVIVVIFFIPKYHAMALTSAYQV